MSTECSRHDWKLKEQSSLEELLLVAKAERLLVEAGGEPAYAIELQCSKCRTLLVTVISSKELENGSFTLEIKRRKEDVL